MLEITALWYLCSCSFFSYAVSKFSFCKLNLSALLEIPPAFSELNFANYIGKFEIAVEGCLDLEVAVCSIRICWSSYLDLSWVYTVVCSIYCILVLLLRSFHQYVWIGDSQLAHNFSYVFDFGVDINLIFLFDVLEIRITC